MGDIQARGGGGGGGAYSKLDLQGGAYSRGGAYSKGSFPDSRRILCFKRSRIFTQKIIKILS